MLESNTKETVIGVWKRIILLPFLLIFGLYMATVLMIAMILSVLRAIWLLPTICLGAAFEKKETKNGN